MSGNNVQFPQHYDSDFSDFDCAEIPCNVFFTFYSQLFKAVLHWAWRQCKDISQGNICSIKSVSSFGDTYTLMETEI